MTVRRRTHVHVLTVPAWVIDMIEDYDHLGWGLVCLGLALLCAVVI